MANTYATLDDLRRALNISHTSDDAILQIILDTAAQKIDRFCNRPDGFLAATTASARVYAGSGGPVQPIDECISISKVEIKEDITSNSYVELSSSDWIAFRGNARAPEFNRTPYTAIMVNPGGKYAYFPGGRLIGQGVSWDNGASGPVEHGVPTVRVTARWGYAEEVPEAIRLATIMQAGRWFKRLQSGMSDGIGNVEFGFVLYRQPVDPDITDLLVQGRYVRRAVG